MKTAVAYQRHYVDKHPPSILVSAMFFVALTLSPLAETGGAEHLLVKVLRLETKQFSVELLLILLK